MLGVEVGRLGLGDHRIACPRCDKGARDDALSVTVRTDGFVWNCFRCGWRGADARETSAPTFTARAPAAPKPARRRGLAPPALARWESAERLAGTLADIYLRTRRCYMPPLDGALRFLPECLHWPTQTRHPAMVALVTDAISSDPLSLHFTFLRPDGRGKADIEKQKLLLPGHEIGGGVIRLWPDDCVTTGLGIAEGIETALSAGHLFRPMWATVDAGHMAKFPVLPGIESLSIFVDADDAGRSAARACAERWHAAGREVARFVSDQGGDFNDAARR